MNKKFFEDKLSIPRIFKQHSNNNHCNEIQKKTLSDDQTLFLLSQNKEFKYTYQDEYYPVQIQLRENTRIYHGDLRFLDNNNLIQKLFLIVVLNTKETKFNKQSLLSFISSFTNLYFQKKIQSHKLEETLYEINDIIHNHNNLLISVIKVLVCFDSFGQDFNTEKIYYNFLFLFKEKYSLYLIFNNFMIFPLNQGMNYIFFPNTVIKPKTINILPCLNNNSIDDNQIIITTKGFNDNLTKQVIKKPLLNYEIKENGKDCVIYLEKGFTLLSAQLDIKTS